MHKGTKELLEVLGIDMEETDEEQQVGIRLFRRLLNVFEHKKIEDWLFCEEWEDALVPVRLPKGLADQLKLMDEAKADFMELDRCSECKTKATCTLNKRNPSEILLTTLVKHAFARIIAEIAVKGGE